MAVARLLADKSVYARLGPMAYCHFPAGQAMRHAPAAGESCLFVTMSDGPFDIEALGEEAGLQA